MAAKNSSRDPRAGVRPQPPVASPESLRSRVVESATPCTQPVGKVLETLQAQAKEAMPGSIFDDGTTTETTPLMKRMRSEIGSAEVSAKRHNSDLQARVAIEVRCDRDEEGVAGRYQVRSEGHVICENKEGSVEAEIPVSITVNDADGSLELNADEMRKEIVAAVRSTGSNTDTR